MLTVGAVVVASGHDRSGKRRLIIESGIAAQFAENYCGWIIAGGVEVGLSLSASLAPCWYRRWRRPTCRRATGSAARRPFGTRTRTGSRCTILVKLPVALSGGSSVNTEPAAGAMLSTCACELAMAIGVHRDRHRLTRTDALELRLLEIGIDIDVVERHHIAEPLPHHDEVAGGNQAIGEDAVDRRTHRGEIEIALGLGERCLQFGKLRAGFGLLRLGDLDIVACASKAACADFTARSALVAPGFGDFERSRARQNPCC